MYFVKLSILLLYLRIFNVSRTFRHYTYAAIVVVTTHSVVGFVSTFVTCNPVKMSCTNVIPLSIFSSVMNILTDIIILILPLWQVLKMQINQKQKIGLIAVFASGSL